jgi:8-oxo-dGTP diphosphatase
MAGHGPSVRAAGLLIDKGKVLLVRQGQGEQARWLLPGGGVERGEPLGASLKREMREECGLDVTVSLPPLALVEVISPDRGATRHLLQVIFHLTLSGTEREVLPPRDPVIKELRWVSADGLVSLALHPPIADLLCDWLTYFAAGDVASARTGTIPPFVLTGPRWLPATRWQPRSE